MNVNHRSTHFLIRLDSDPTKYHHADVWVEPGHAKLYTLTEATKDAARIRAAGTPCSIVPA